LIDFLEKLRAQILEKERIAKLEKKKQKALNNLSNQEPRSFKLGNQKPAFIRQPKLSELAELNPQPKSILK